MSVSVEKRRQVAELENFERRIAQEKRRLMSELDSLEKHLGSLRGSSLVQGFSREIARSLRAASEAASVASPLWFYVVAAIIVVGGAGLVTSVALKSHPSERSETAAIQREAKIIQPTPQSVAAVEPPAKVAASIEPATPAGNIEAPKVAMQEQETAPAGMALQGGKAIEAEAANTPPVPLPPPAAKADVVAAPPLPNPAAVSALDPARPKTSFDDAPPLDIAAPQSPVSVERAELEREPERAGARRQAKCFVKVDGRVIFEHVCPVRQPKQSTLMLDLGEKPVVLSLGRGRTWTATLGGRRLGKVYKSGQCWGRRRQVYICAHGA